ADSVVTFKYAVRSIAKRFGMHATFMPKPKEGVAGSGMHLNISVYKDGRNIFNIDSLDQKIGDEARWFIGGILSHVKEICAISNPLVNSYKRLLTGFEAPRDIIWTTQNKNALVKVHKRVGEDSKVELRFPDPSANPYLVLAMCLAAGMEGIIEKTEPGEQAPMCYESEAPENLPDNLREAVLYMKNSTFAGKVLGKEFRDIYTEIKTREWNDYMIQVSDWEIKKYLVRV
ncbi:MAG: type I glutamate--ammonia ligase, partial [Lachnospiraceae bacterium]|nr:type I glutamate--ammonia ligase [Lachnospiraceae bacterium]